MADPIDLSTKIAAVVNGAAARGRAVAIAYVGDDGAPAISFRGSTQIHGPEQLAIWARKSEGGIATAVARRPHVSLLFFDPESNPRYISFKGRAHADPAANDAVYNAMIQAERDADPDRNGVAVLIDVDVVFGNGPDGPFQQSRA